MFWYFPPAVGWQSRLQRVTGIVRAEDVGTNSICFSGKERVRAQRTQRGYGGHLASHLPLPARPAWPYDQGSCHTALSLSVPNPRQ